MRFNSSRSFRNIKTAFFFLTPNLAGFLIFTSIPIIVTFILCFYKCDLLQTKNILSWKFIGFDNFTALLGFHREGSALVPNDPEFWSFLYNTIFLLMRIPISIFISLGLALLLNNKFKGTTIFRTIFFLPTICTGTALYMLWRWIYNSDFGLLNLILSKISFGTINGIKWLVNPSLAKPAFVLMNVWAEMGGINLILYLAALGTIPKEFYEAASIDGAGPWHKFRHVTWPLLGPVTFFIVIMNLINDFQGFFQQANIMTQGGPAGATTTLSYYIYNQAYVWNHMGYASVVSIILFAIILIFTAISWKYGKGVVHYK